MRPMMLRILRWGGLLAVAMFVIGGWIGWATAGGPGLVSAILGTGLAIVFMALTAASFLIADAVTKGKPSIVVFFGTILGVFAVKVVVFVILTIWLRTQTWLSPSVFGVTAIIAVVGTLVIDFVASARSRIPYVDVVLPAASGEASGRSDEASDGSRGEPGRSDRPSETPPKS